MSALTPKADIDWSLSHVRFVPKADIQELGSHKKKTRDIAQTMFNVKVSNYSCQIKYERQKNQVLRKTLISSRKRVQQGSLSKIR
jgi:hypothetical protein